MAVESLAEVLGNYYSNLICYATFVPELKIRIFRQPILKEKREALNNKLDDLLEQETSTDKLSIEQYKQLLSEIRVIAEEPLQFRQKNIDDLREQANLSDQEISSRRLHVSRNLTTITNLVGMGTSLMGAAIVSKDGMGMNMQGPFLFAAGAYLFDMNTNRKGDLFSLPRLTALGVSLGPTVTDIINQWQAGSYLFEHTKNLISTPLLALISSFAHPFTAFSNANNKLNLSIKRAKYALDIPTFIRQDMRRIDYVISQIDILQKMNEFKDASPEAIQQFDIACINYLNRTGPKNNIKLRRKVRELTPSENPRRIQTVELEPEVVQTAKELLYPQTYTFALQMGVDDLTARKFAQVLPSEQVVHTITRIESILGESTISVVATNPSLFFLQGAEREKYLSQLQTVSERPDFNDHLQHPTRLSSLEGLEYISRPEISTNGSSEQLSKARYENHRLVEAILQHGLRLRTARPHIGMCYVYMPRIKHRVHHSPGITSRDMQEFDRVFGMLIKDKVIWTEKENKGSGGKYSGCYSLNPSLNDISKPTLREYVKNMLYNPQRPKLSC